MDAISPKRQQQPALTKATAPVPASIVHAQSRASQALLANSVPEPTPSDSPGRDSSSQTLTAPDLAQKPEARNLSLGRSQSVVRAPGGDRPEPDHTSLESPTRRVQEDTGSSSEGEQASLRLEPQRRLEQAPTHRKKSAKRATYSPFLNVVRHVIEASYRSKELSKDATKTAVRSATAHLRRLSKFNQKPRDDLAIQTLRSRFKLPSLQSVRMAEAIKAKVTRDQVLQAVADGLRDAMECAK